MVKCDCMCHREGFNVMHFMPCCGLTYQTYMDENGVIDEDKLKTLEITARKFGQ